MAEDSRDGIELGALMKSFLDDVGREAKASAEIKDIRSSKKKKCTALMDIMKDRDLKS